MADHHFAAEVLEDSAPFRDVALNRDTFLTKVKHFGLVGIGGKTVTIQTDTALERGDEIHGTHDGEKRVGKVTYPIIKDIQILDPATAKTMRADAHKEEMAGFGVAGLAALVAGYEFLKERSERRALARAQNGQSVGRRRPLLTLLVGLGVVAAALEAQEHKQQIDNAIHPIKNSDLATDTKTYAQKLYDHSITPQQVQGAMVDKAMGVSNWSGQLSPQATDQAKKRLFSASAQYVKYIQQHASTLWNNPSNEQLNAATDQAQTFETIRTEIGLSTMSVTTPAQSTWAASPYNVKNIRHPVHP